MKNPSKPMTRVKGCNSCQKSVLMRKAKQEQIRKEIAAQRQGLKIVIPKTPRNA